MLIATSFFTFRLIHVCYGYFYLNKDGVGGKEGKGYIFEGSITLTNC